MMQAKVFTHVESDFITCRMAILTLGEGGEELRFQQDYYIFLRVDNLLEP